MAVIGGTLEAEITAWCRPRRLSAIKCRLIAATVLSVTALAVSDPTGDHASGIDHGNAVATERLPGS